MKNPGVLAAAAVVGLILFQRNAAARARVAGASARTTADYFNPVELAASFGRAVVGLTRNVATTEPAGIFAVKGPIVPGTAASGLLGWQTYDPGGIGDPYGSWVTPTDSSVTDSSVTRSTPIVDSIVAGPVYDPALQFTQNPTAWFGLGP